METLLRHRDSSVRVARDSRISGHRVPLLLGSFPRTLRHRRLEPRRTLSPPFLYQQGRFTQTSGRPSTFLEVKNFTDKASFVITKKEVRVRCFHPKRSRKRRQAWLPSAVASTQTATVPWAWCPIRAGCCGGRRSSVLCSVRNLILRVRGDCPRRAPKECLSDRCHNPQNDSKPPPPSRGRRLFFIYQPL